MSSFSWGDFLSLAERLAASNNEADLRTAVSRAYYSAFHSAKAYVSGKYGGPGKGNSHEKTWDALIMSSDANEQLVGQWGGNLKRLRQRADYDLVPQVTSAQQAISSARKVLGKLKELKELKEAG